MRENFRKCIGCVDRHIGCHSSCENYIKAKQKLAEENAIIRETKLTEMVFIDGAKRIMDKHAMQRKRR